MPRGTKTCGGCGGANGPRAFFCKHCNTPFVIKGKEATPMMRAAADTDDYMEHFNEIDYSHDPSNVKYYDCKAKCWESKCGGYRIRKYETFMGIDVGHNRRIVLESKVSEGERQDAGPDWNIVSRHVALKSAARRYVRLKRKLKIQRTKGEERSAELSRRISAGKNPGRKSV